MSTTAQSASDAYHHGDLRLAILKRAAEIINDSGLEALTLRGIARDLGVSHGAPNRHFRNRGDLLVSLATGGWEAVQAATLEAAESSGSHDPHVRLNAMGKAFLRWALEHPALFRSISHPDVARYADESLVQATEKFKDVIRSLVAETQADGRSPDVPLPLLTLFTNAVPFGAACLILDPLLSTDTTNVEQEDLIEQLINLVVPLPAT